MGESRILLSKVIQLIVLCSVVLTFSNNLKAQCIFTQIGIDIDGEANNDQSGSRVSVSADGSTVAIAAPYNSGGGTNRGHVRVYKNISGTWTQLGTDIDGVADFDFSGFSVSLSSDGNTVAIGALQNAGGGTERGQVRVYKNMSGTWTQQGADINGEANNDRSGLSVSLSADGLTVAIGAANNAGGGTDRGHVRVYKIISGTWTQQGADIDGEANNDESGRSVSLSADGLTVAIGAPFNAGGGIQRGQVRVYKNISGTWTQQGADIDGEANVDWSGEAISLTPDGLTVVIGAFFNAGGGTFRGHARVYKNMSGTWTQQGGDIDGEADVDLSGCSVAISADGLTVAIGAYGNAGGGSSRGHVRIYKNISGTWTQQGLDIDGEADNDQSGISVSLSSDGLTAAIGAQYNAGNGSNSGHVRVYQMSCSNCNFSSALPTTAGTYTSTQSNTSNGFVCFCDANDNLLLALDTNGTGAVIPANGISLEIGTTATSAWNNAGGIISNPNGGAVFNRKWNVAPTVQPTNPVKVKYFFTDVEYDSVVARLTPMGTNITAPSDLEMYKLVSNGFDDPHAGGAAGTILANGSTPSLTNWVYAVQGSNHSAEFLVSSFSGGGGGAGAGGAPLPVDLLDFRANLHADKTIHLNWSTASEINNSHFEIERSYDGVNFTKIAQQAGTNSQSIQSYIEIDVNYNQAQTVIYYRLMQVDFNGAFTYSDIRKVNLAQTDKPIELVVYPNPSNGTVHLSWNANTSNPMQITILDLQGKQVFNQTINSAEGYQTQAIDLSKLDAGVYIIQTLTNNNYEQLKLIIK